MTDASAGHDYLLDYALYDSKTYSSRFAAVGSECRTRAERRLVGRNEHDGLRYLFGPTHPFEWYTRDQAGLPFVISRKPGQHPGVDRTRCNRIDTHPRLRRFEGCRLRQPFDRVLAGCVNRGAGCSHMTIGRRHIDDAALALGHHHAELMLHAEQRAEHVGIEGGG